MDRITAADVFVTIVEHGSLSAAAERLNMSRPKITRYLAAMETWTGSRLLHRSTRRLSLTPTGETVLSQCRDLLRAAGEVENVIETDGEVIRGTLRVACPPIFGKRVLIPIFHEFLLHNPLVNLDINSGHRSVDLISERVDLAIRITNELYPNLIARRLGECQSVVCAAPEYLNRAGTPKNLDDLSQHNCLVYSYFDKDLWFFNRDDAPCSMAVSGNLRSNESSMLLKATLTGVGISMLPEFAVRDHINSGALMPLLPDFEPQVLRIFGLFNSRQHMPRALRLLIDLLVKRLKSYR